MPWDDLAGELSEMFGGLEGLKGLEGDPYLKLELSGVRIIRDLTVRTTARINRVRPFPISPHRLLTQEQANCARMILDTDPGSSHRTVAEFFGVPRAIITHLIRDKNRYREKEYGH